jgi:lysophospholipase L1-like esterase
MSAQGGAAMRTYVRLGLLLAVALALAVLLPSPKGASGTTTSYPDSMAALGDSMTQAMNPSVSLLGDWPEYSWSTGDNNAVQSQYLRILRPNSLIDGNNYNDAVSGAKMTHLNGQAQTAVSQGVEYVTVLMGANDVCTSSEGTMTPVETFRSQFQEAMDTLTSGLPEARIFVASIPDIYRLWFILNDNPSAVFMWNNYDICQSMLENPTSTEQADVERRERVRQRNIDFNTVLSEVCDSYSQCRFDNNAVFDSQFDESEVSDLDYFHPSITGQANLARLTWSVTYDFYGPVGGIAELPDGSASPERNYVALAALAAAAVVALGAGEWYARRQ